MISRIRGTLHTSAYRYIMWSVLIIFIVSSLSFGLLFRDSGTTIMRVNGYPITKIELSHKFNAIDSRIKAFRQQFGSHADQFLQYMGLAGDPQQLALNELMREKLLLSAADALHLKELSNEYVVKKLKNSTFALQHLGMLVPPYFYNSVGELNEKAVLNHLSRQSISPSRFEELLEEALRQFFVMSLLPAAVYISLGSLRGASQQEQVKNRTYKVYELRVADYLTELKKSKISDQELKSYFEKHNKNNKRYWSNETRSGKAWKFSVEGYGIKDLTKEKFAARFMGDARRALAQNNEAALQEFIQKHAGKSLVLNNKSLTEESHKDSQLLEKLFSIKALGKSAVAFFEESGYVVTLTAIQERVFVPFESVSERVLNDLLKEKAIQKLGSQVDTLLQSNNPESIKEFLNGLPVSARTLTINDSKNWDEAKKNGLPVDRMKKMIHPGYTVMYDLNNDDGIGILLLESFKRDDSTEEKESQRKALLEKMYAHELNTAAAAFIDSLQKNATL